MPLTVSRATISPASSSSTEAVLVDGIANVLYRYKDHLQREVWGKVKVAATTAGAALEEKEKTEGPACTRRAPCLDNIRKGVAAMLANDDLGYIYTATTTTTDSNNGAIVAVAVIHREVSDWRAGFVWYINTLAVDPCVFADPAVGLPPVVFPSSSEVAAAAAAASSSSAASDAVLALVEGIRAAVQSDETANGFRVMLEDPLDIMQRPFYKTNGQYDGDANTRHRMDSSAAHVGLLVETPAAAAHHHDGGDDSSSSSSKLLHREHYFMMTWYKEE